MIDPWDNVLSIYYGDDDAGKKTVSDTGFDMKKTFIAQVTEFPFWLNELKPNSGAELVLHLIENSVSLSPWTISSCDEDIVQIGAAYICNDRLMFSTEADAEFAKTFFGFTA